MRLGGLRVIACRPHPTRRRHNMVHQAIPKAGIQRDDADRPSRRRTVGRRQPNLDLHNRAGVRTGLRGKLFQNGQTWPSLHPVSLRIIRVPHTSSRSPRWKRVSGLLIRALENTRSEDASILYNLE